MPRRQKGGTVWGVGKRIREYRQMIGLRGYQFAKVIGVSQGSLSDIENEKSLPSADTLAKIESKTALNSIWVMLGRGAMEKLNVKTLDPALYKMVNQLTRIYRAGDKYAIGQINKHFKEIEGR